MTSVEKHTLIALKEGQKKAFEIIYRFYNGGVYHFIYAIIKDTNIAQDLTQDVFLIIWNRKEDIDSNANFEGYLFKIARNIVYHYVKRELLLQNYIEKKSKEKDSEDSEVEDDLDNNFLEEYIMKLISELPESRKMIFLLYWKTDMNYKEIAVKLSISEKTVSTQVQRSLHFLRTRIGRIAFMIFWSLLAYINN